MHCLPVKIHSMKSCIFNCARALSSLTREDSYSNIVMYCCYVYKAYRLAQQPSPEAKENTVT